jgi:hypothetical protein
MRKVGSLLLSVAVAVTLVGVASSAQAQEHMMPKGEEVTLTNVQVIDLHCYTAGGMKGEMHKQCNIACAEAGVPLGLLSEDGKVYVPVSKAPMTGQAKFNDLLVEHAEQFVNVTGTLFERGGVLGIEIQSVESAS